MLKIRFEHHTKFLTVHAYKKAVCDWCQSAKTECTHLPCGHVIHSVCVCVTLYVLLYTADVNTSHQLHCPGSLYVAVDSRVGVPEI